MEKGHKEKTAEMAVLKVLKEIPNHASSGPCLHNKVPNRKFQCIFRRKKEVPGLGHWSGHLP